MISFSTLEAGYTIVIEAELQDGYQVLTPAVGGGPCTDGSYVRNVYKVNTVGQEIAFDMQITEAQEDNIEYMIRNYTEFFLSYSTKTAKAGINEFQFGTGNDQIKFVILEEDI